MLNLMEEMKKLEKNNNEMDELNKHTGRETDGNFPYLS